MGTDYRSMGRIIAVWVRIIAVWVPKSTSSTLDWQSTNVRFSIRCAAVASASAGTVQSAEPVAAYVLYASFSPYLSNPRL
jgi:hypothetical protein